MDLPAHHAPFAERYRSAGWWSREPVPDFLAQWASEAPQRTAIVDRNGALNYGTLQRLVRRAAAGLWAQGVRPGHVVALQLPNWYEFAVYQQAAARMGAIYLPLLVQLRGGDIEYLLSVSRAAVIVIPDEYRGFDYRAMLRECHAQLPDLKRIIVVGEAGESGGKDSALVSSIDFLAQDWEREHGAAVDAVRVDPDAVRQILFTSGTESKPKGVMHSFNTAFYPLKLHQRYFDLNSDDAIFTCSPVGHGTGAHFGVELGLFLGGKVVLQEKWEPARAVETIARERCTMMWGATTFYNDLVNAPNLAEHDLSAFRLACSAGAPIPRALVSRVHEVLGANLVAAFGQSEGHNISINRLDDPPDQVANSDGRINPGVEYKLVDAERRPVPAGERGEFAYRGPNVCLGYLDPEHNARAFDAEGFIYSGDLAEVDADGYLRVVGRKKDIIIRGGENISPAEIEDLLFRHPLIADVVVIGIADERLGQRACAVVIPKAGAKPVLQDIVDFLAQKNIAKFKYPEYLEVVDEFPRTASGKVRKEVLRETLRGALHGTITEKLSMQAVAKK